MLFIIALIIAVLFSLFCGKVLKKHPYIFYILAIAISLITVLISTNVINTRELPAFINNYIISLFTKGALPTALWAVVMWTGALPNGSWAMKKLIVIRGELSIFTAILTLGHNIGYGKTYFVRFFTDMNKLQTNYIVACVLTIMLLLIMIPLTIMSFPKIRKKINAKTWKKVQRLAYLFYAMIYVHIMFLYIPFARIGRDGYLLSVIVYSIVFIGYAVFRVRKFYVISCKKSKKEPKLLPLNIIATVTFIIPLSIMTFVAYSKQNTPNSINTNTNTSSSINVNINLSTNEKDNNDLTNSTYSDINTSDNITESDNTVSKDDVSSNVDNTTTSIDENNSSSITSSQSYTSSNISDNSTATSSNISDISTVVSEIQTPSTAPESKPEPEPFYIYNDGTFTGSAYGYDGDIQVSVTIEQDKIIAITATSYESDLWYFEEAKSSVISQIISTQSCNVDAVSGATYSSNAIMSATAQAVNSAKK